MDTAADTGAAGTTAAGSDLTAGDGNVGSTDLILFIFKVIIALI